MASLVNANFGIYFTDTGDADRVRCKVCRKSLKSRRIFNLKQHLRHAHKIEVRSNRKLPDLKKQQGHTFKSANYWDCFSKSDEICRVTCKICSKSLKSTHIFNLKQHLKHSHNIEIQLEKSSKNQLLPCSNEIVLCSANEDSLHERSAAENNSINIQSLDSNDSFSRLSASPNIVKIKEEFQKYCIESAEHKKPIEDTNCENDDNGYSPPIQNPPIQPSYSETLIEPVIITRANGDINDQLNGSNALINNEGFESRLKKNTKAPLIDDESTIYNKTENFEELVKRKKLLLEIEELEMRNYKLKLELWEKEQNLNLSCSKFTRHIN